MKDNFKEIARLVEKLKTHDQTIFPKLYELTYQRIYLLCFSILKNEEDAKDAVQETYIRILANISSLQDNKLFVAWANKIAYNICMRMLSKSKNELIEVGFLSNFSNEGEYSNPYTFLEKAEKAKALSAIIDNLAPHLRDTLIFKYVDDLKIKQIAEIMDCPEGTVKSRLNMAKKILKKAIKREKNSDILLSAFAYFPLREALAFSASRSPMTLEVANAAFEDIVLRSGMSNVASFTPQPAVKPIMYSLASTVVAGRTAIGTCGIVLVAAVISAPPSIREIQVQQPDSGYTNEAVTITARIETPLNAIADIYLLSDNTGRRFESSMDQKNIVSFRVAENGTYTLHAITTNNLEATAKATVTAIDNKAPTVVGFTYTQTELVLELDDVYSGVDLETITGETISGEQILPIALDEAGKTVTFDFPKENFRLSLKDLSGNISYYNVSRVNR